MATRAGLPVDSSGLAAIDPTANVNALVKEQGKLFHALIKAERRYNDRRAAHQKEIGKLRASYEEKLSAKESSRLDSIRQVDREDVAKAAASANLAIGTLAKNTTDLAATLQTQRTTDMSEVSKRVSALELALSASAGKQQVADPMMAEFLAEVKSLRAGRAGDAGGAEALAKAQERGYKFIGLMLTAGGIIVAVILKFG